MSKMTFAEQRKNIELMEKLRTAIIRANLGGILDTSEKDRPTKEAQTRECCLHYHKLKIMLGIK